jgi:hypothetical protein
MFLEKPRDGRRSRYLILQHASFTRLCSMITEVDTIFFYCIQLIEENQRKKIL